MAGINENLIKLIESNTRLSEQVGETKKGIAELRLALFGIEGATGIIKALHDLGSMVNEIKESTGILQISHNSCMGKRKALEEKVISLEKFKNDHTIENENLKSWREDCHEKIKTLERDNEFLKQFKQNHDTEDLANKKTWHAIVWLLSKTGITIGGIVSIAAYLHEHWDKFKLFCDTFLKSK